MRPWTLAMAPNAASNAKLRSTRCVPEMPISTKVPSSGRARRMLADAGAIDRQNPFDTLGEMHGRQRRAGNIPNIVADLDVAAVRFPDNLRKPARTSDLAAIGFAIFQDFHSADPASR